MEKLPESNDEVRMEIGLGQAEFKQSAFVAMYDKINELITQQDRIIEAILELTRYTANHTELLPKWGELQDKINEILNVN